MLRQRLLGSVGAGQGDDRSSENAIINLVNNASDDKELTKKEKKEKKVALALDGLAWKKLPISLSMSRTSWARHFGASGSQRKSFVLHLEQFLGELDMRIQCGDLGVSAGLEIYSSSSLDDIVVTLGSVVDVIADMAKWDPSPFEFGCDKKSFIKQIKKHCVKIAGDLAGDLTGDLTGGTVVGGGSLHHPGRSAFHDDASASSSHDGMTASSGNVVPEFAGLVTDARELLRQQQEEEAKSARAAGLTQGGLSGLESALNCFDMMDDGEAVEPSSGSGLDPKRRKIG